MLKVREQYLLARKKEAVPDELDAMNVVPDDVDFIKGPGFP